MSKPVVAFVCLHNACRSQIAEALGRLLAGDVLESCSAGTEPKDRIDPNAVRLMRTQYGVEMERSPQVMGIAQTGGFAHYHGLRRLLPRSALPPAGGLGAGGPHRLRGCGL